MVASVAWLSDMREKLIRNLGLVVTIISFLGLGGAYLGWFVKNDTLFWTGMVLAMPLFLAMTLFVLLFIWAVFGPPSSKQPGDEAKEVPDRRSLMADILSFYGAKGLGLIVAAGLSLLVAEPSQSDTIVGFLGMLLFLSGLFILLFFGHGFSFRQFRRNQYTGANRCFQRAPLVGLTLVVVGFFVAAVVEVYLIALLALLSQRGFVF